MKNAAVPQSGVSYALYDKVTGEVVQSYSRVSVETDKSVEVPIDELKADLSRDRWLISRLTDANPENLGIIRIEPSEAKRSAGLLAVDVRKETLVVKPTLVLTSDKDELAGDGEDRAVIEVHVQDAQGMPMRDFNDEIRITTERGKLSERGGLVAMKAGYAKIELTSVRETVRRVRVRATSVSGKAGSDEIVLEFV